MISFRQFLNEVILHRGDKNPDPKWKDVTVTVSINDGLGWFTKEVRLGGRSQWDVHMKLSKLYHKFGHWKVIDYEFHDQR